MTRGIPSHPVLAAILALALLASFSAPAGAAPAATTGAGDTPTINQSIVLTDGPGNRFGFSQASVLAQATTITKTISNVGGTGQPAGTTTATVSPGQSVTFQVSYSTDPGITGQVVDFATSGANGLLFVGGDNCAAGAPPAGVVTPAGTNSFNCLPNVAGGTTIAINFSVSSTATAGSSLTNQACLYASGALQGGCSTVTLTVAAQSITNSQAQSQAQSTPGFSSGTAGVPCAALVGQTCTITGADSGSCSVTGSMSCTNTATVPAGAAAGSTPIAVLSTTNGFEFITCTQVLLGTTTVTCNGTTTGNVLQGSTKAVCFPGVTACVLGTVSGPGALPPIILPNLPLLPPPPLEFIPPPPPPLLPPPPPAPMGATRMAGFPEVPVIPEADSLFLLVGGLVALGGLVGYRRLRRRED
jgi:hypothetical protein